MPSTKTLADLSGEESIDSRDLIERLAELTDRYEDDPASLDEDERAEMVTLESICDEGEASFADWTYGVSLVREDRFEDHARQLAEDIGAIDPNASWPLSYIDWVAAADALRIDYSEIEIDGRTYLGR